MDINTSSSLDKLSAFERFEFDILECRKEIPGNLMKRMSISSINQKMEEILLLPETEETDCIELNAVIWYHLMFLCAQKSWILEESTRNNERVHEYKLEINTEQELRQLILFSECKLKVEIKPNQWMHVLVDLPPDEDDAETLAYIREGMKQIRDRLIELGNSPSDLPPNPFEDEDEEEEEEEGDGQPPAKKQRKAPKTAPIRFEFVWEWNKLYINLEKGKRTEKGEVLMF